MNTEHHHFARAGIHLTLVALATGLVLVSPRVFAGEGYIGFGAGRSDATNIGDDAKQFCADAGLTCTSKNSDKAYKAFVGYKFNPYIGIEGGYVDLGGISASAPAASGSPKLSATVKGYTLSVVPEIPISHSVSVFAKAGAFVWNAKLKATSDAFGLKATTSDSSAGVAVGAGAAINMNDQSALRIEWERYSLDEKFSNNTKSLQSNNDIDLISASLLFRFK